MVKDAEGSSAAGAGESRVLRSPALYSGEVVLPPDRPRGASRRLSGRAIKNFTFPLLYGLARRTPPWLTLLPFRLLALLARPLYLLRRNPLRQAVEDFAVIAARAGRQYAPADLYRAYLRNAVDIVRGYIALQRDGVAAALARVQANDDECERVRRLVAEHSGAIFAVGHNFGSVYSAARLSREFPVLVISKNSSTAQRTRMAIELFERMETTVLMVRGGSPLALSRAMYRALREGLGLAATVENVDYGEHRLEVEMFGTSVGVSPWAATIAAKRLVPVIPMWFSSVPGGVQVAIGEELIASDAQALVRHYMGYFEQQILADPASWAYLADKHWRRVLRRAARGGAPPDAAAATTVNIATP